MRFFWGVLLLCVSLAAQAGDFTLEDMQGKTHRLSDYRGKWVLVNLWATWCPACQSEIPELSALHNAHKNTDLVVIGIVTEYRSGKDVADFARAHGISYPVVLGNQRIIAQIGRLKVLPSSYLYNPAGEQVVYQPGELTQEAVENYIKSRQ
jgi:thiol-disulfide isomerase/thioredoxin